MTAKQTWYDADGNRQTKEISVLNASHAYQLAAQEWSQNKEAYCFSSEINGDGSFVMRVMSKERMILKIQSVAA